MSIKFKLTCESCRRHVEHRATPEQYQKLLQKLRCTFPCPSCRSVIQVEMIGDGLSYSTVMPTSSIPDETDAGLGASSRVVRGQPDTGFPEGEPENQRFAVPAHSSLDMPVAHVPFKPLDSPPVERLQGRVSQEFLKWYKKYPMFVLSPLLLILVLLLLWEPGSIDDSEISDKDAAVDKSSLRDEADPFRGKQAAPAEEGKSEGMNDSASGNHSGQTPGTEVVEPSLNENP